MGTHTERAENRTDRRHASGVQIPDAQAQAEALNEEFALLQAQAQALLREARAGRLPLRRSRR